MVRGHYIGSIRHKQLIKDSKISKQAWATRNAKLAELRQRGVQLRAEGLRILNFLTENESKLEPAIVERFYAKLESIATERETLCQINNSIIDLTQVTEQHVRTLYRDPVNMSHMNGKKGINANLIHSICDLIGDPDLFPEDD